MSVNSSIVKMEAFVKIKSMAMCANAGRDLMEVIVKIVRFCSGSVKLENAI